MDLVTPLPADLDSPAVARREVRSALADRLAPPSLDELELLVSEVVTNAVLHVGSRLTLTVSFDGARVRVGVTDAGGGDVVVRNDPADQPTGRGLLIVDRLSERWGVDRNGDGTKTVWFVVRVEEGETSSDGDRSGRVHPGGARLVPTPTTVVDPRAGGAPRGDGDGSGRADADEPRLPTTPGRPDAGPGDGHLARLARAGSGPGSAR